MKKALVTLIVTGVATCALAGAAMAGNKAASITGQSQVPADTPVYISSYTATKNSTPGSKVVNASGSWYGGNSFYSVTVDWDDVMMDGSRLQAVSSGSATSKSWTHQYAADRVSTAYTTLTVKSNAATATDFSNVALSY